MDMQQLQQVLEALGVTVAPGYPKNNTQLPYMVHRPLVTDPADQALCGQALDWDVQHTVYCCGESVEASYNMAKALLQHLQTVRQGNTTLSASLGYVGAQLEGHYETQVTIQLNQGALL